MDSVVQFFETMPSSYRSVLLVGGLVSFWVLEGAVPLFPNTYRRMHHAALNVLLTFFQLVIAVAFGAVILKTVAYTDQHQFGLLYQIAMPLWLRVLIGVLLLDFAGGYLIHWTEHKVSWMWRFHVIHHTDKNVDVTTGLRHHPVETFFRLGSQWLAIGLGGIPIGVVFLYQVLSVFFAQLTHANIRLPRGVDRWFSYVLVSPNMHKVHHHCQKPLTDRNYGNVFSIWDRMLGTFVEVDPDTLDYGIDSLMHSEDHDRLGRLLILPFEKQCSALRDSQTSESASTASSTDAVR